MEEVITKSAKALSLAWESQSRADEFVKACKENCELRISIVKEAVAMKQKEAHHMLEKQKKVYGERLVDLLGKAKASSEQWVELAEKASKALRLEVELKGNMVKKIVGEYEKAAEGGRSEQGGKETVNEDEYGSFDKKAYQRL